MRTLGIDVSHWQKDVSWRDVATSEAKFVFVKASEGNAGVDAYFEKNWRGTQEAGLFRGAYHFGRPGNDAVTQAVHFHSVVGALGFRDLPPVLDLEAADGHPAAHVLTWARAFVDKAEQLFGRQLIVYTGQFWKGNLGNPKDEFFGARPLWLAAYQAEAKLVVPASWQRWTFWQYTDGGSNKPAHIAGLAPSDQSWFDGDESALDALCRGDSPQPPAAPDALPGAAWPGELFVWPRTPALRGGCVKVWQERILALGYAVDSDGVYGPQSKTACRAFQRNRGLVADGIVGKTTWDATFAAPLPG